MISIRRRSKSSFIRLKASQLPPRQINLKRCRQCCVWSVDLRSRPNVGGRFLTYERQKVRRQEGERGRKMELPHDARLPCNSFRPLTLTLDVIETSQTECDPCGFKNSFRQPLAFYLLCIARTVAATTVQRPPPAALATAFSHESIRRKRREETEERERAKSEVRSGRSQRRGHGRQLFRRRRRRSGGRSPTKISRTRQEVRH